MRLLNVRSLELKQFVESKIPQYVILSHTWGDDEVLFEDLSSDQAVTKKAYPKVRGCCKRALEDGFEWVWIDSCCIDKSSSAELSEAINSMYQWYKDSAICYAYLEDVDSIALIEDAKVFYRSRWLTRGWTLQELIAPTVVEFYSAQWEEIGTKSSLSDPLSNSTGIPSAILRGKSPHRCQVAERMSWASKRNTTREEDKAYSLLGLFDINMPMIYGEGAKAFTRLQQEIIKAHEDYSIFSWTSSIFPFRDDSSDFRRSYNVLAPSPAAFSLPFTVLSFDQNAEYGVGTLRFEILKFQGYHCMAADSPWYTAPSSKMEHGSTAIDLSHSTSLKTSIGGIDNEAEPVARDALIVRANHWQRNDMPDQNIPRSTTLVPMGLSTHYLPEHFETPIKPPELTSRGLLVRMLLRKWTSNLFLLFINSWIGGRATCIMVEHQGFSLYARSRAHCLITVDRTQLQHFRLKEIYLLTQSNHGRDLLMYSTPRQVRGKVIYRFLQDDVSDSSYVVSGFPDGSWNQKEIKFSTFSSVIGVLQLKCWCHGQTVRMILALGRTSHSYNTWCRILAMETALPGVELQQLYNKFLIEESLDMMTDRSAVQKNSLWYSATIRRSPDDGEDLVYLLTLTVSKESDKSPWISMTTKSEQ